MPLEEIASKMNLDAAHIGDNKWGFSVVFLNREGNILAIALKSIDQNLESKLSEI